MLDVHILKRDKLDPAVWARCEASVASTRAQVHVLPAEPGHIGRGRIRGFSQGDQPFVTYVDDDDMVTSGLLDYLDAVLARQPELYAIHVPGLCGPEARTSTAPLRAGTTAFPEWRFMYMKYGVPDHMWVLRRDRMPDLSFYEGYPRKGDAKLMFDYVSARTPEDQILQVTHARYHYLKNSG